jgi:serine/threonine protein kinase
MPGPGDDHPFDAFPVTDQDEPRAAPPDRALLRSPLVRPLDVPARIGRYTLLGVIGRGGMAEVFLAKQDGPAGFQKTCVVKRIRRSLAEEPRFVDMFLREARVAARLNHPNAVQIFELGQEEGEYFIAMEHLDGLSLHRMARRSWYADRSLPTEVIVRAVADAALGLHHAHTLTGPDGRPTPLVHRDVSPDNVIVTREGIAKLLDFGIAKFGEIDDVTNAGEVKGKLPFMSPEQLRGAGLDPRSDLWSLGVTSYWLLTGRRPFEAPTDPKTIEAVLSSHPPRTGAVNPLVPPELDAIVMRLLEKNPARRIASGAALAEELLALLGPTEGYAEAAAFVGAALELPDVPARQSPGPPRVAATRPKGPWLQRRPTHTRTGDVPPRLPTPSVAAASLNDASLNDASLNDASLIDASLIDASLIDASSIEASLIDASVEDASAEHAGAALSSPGAARGGVSPADISYPDDSLPDVSLPDVSLPDASLPDASLPDASLPDGSLPDGSLPDGSLPDGSLPDGTLPARLEPTHASEVTLVHSAPLATLPNEPSVDESLEHATGATATWLHAPAIGRRAGVALVAASVTLALLIGGAAVALLLRDDRPVTAAAPPAAMPASSAPAEEVSAQPVPAAPVLAEPAPAEPAPAEPVPAEPVPAEPVPAEPVPAEPVPADPVPAERVPAAEEPDTRLAVRALAPSRVTWKLGSRTLGRGNLPLKLGRSTTSLTAVDAETGGVVTVPVVDGKADYGAVAAGTVIVRVKPWGDVEVGARKLGTTPIDPIVLPAGRYVLRVIGPERTKAIPVEVRADAATTVNVDLRN